MWAGGIAIFIDIFKLKKKSSSSNDSCIIKTVPPQKCLESQLSKIAHTKRIHTDCVVFLLFLTYHHIMKCDVWDLLLEIYSWKIVKRMELYESCKIQEQTLKMDMSEDQGGRGV